MKCRIRLFVAWLHRTGGTDHDQGWDNSNKDYDGESLHNGIQRYKNNKEVTIEWYPLTHCRKIGMAGLTGPVRQGRIDGAGLTVPVRQGRTGGAGQAGLKWLTEAVRISAGSSGCR